MAISKTRMTGLATAGLSLLMLSSPALALEPISVPDGVETAAEAPADGCPLLTRLKYPFLSCSKGENGSITLDQRGTQYRREVPNHDPFVTGVGYWGATPSELGD
jgi:hypothetical protein